MLMLNAPLEAASANLDLDGFFAVNLLESRVVDLGGETVKHDLAGFQGDNPRAIPPGQTQEMERTNI